MVWGARHRSRGRGQGEAHGAQPGGAHAPQGAVQAAPVTAPANGKHRHYGGVEKKEKVPWKNGEKGWSQLENLDLRWFKCKIV